MKQLFLTSSVASVAHHIAKKLDLSKNNKLVFINTAAEPEMGDDTTWLKNDRKSLVEAGFEVTDYTITGKTLEQLKNYLINFDYIYVSGGNTWHLLKESKKSGFFDYVKELILKLGKTYIGTSAGSIITGPMCPDYLLEDDEVRDLEKQKGYEFVNFIILPHWGSEWFRDLYLKERLETTYKTDQYPLLLLTDNQYVHILDEKCEILDVSK